MHSKIFKQKDPKLLLNFDVYLSFCVSHVTSCNSQNILVDEQETWSETNSTAEAYSQRGYTVYKWIICYFVHDTWVVRLLQIQVHMVIDE